MGNAGSRPSCLGEKGQKSQDFLKDSYLKDLGLAPGNSTGRNNVEGRAPPPEKLLLSPVVIENGWNTGVGPGKGQHSSPLPKQNNTDIDVQNRSLGSNALKARLEAAWSPLAGLEPPRCSGGSWPAKPFAATEVTEVTEVTETVVTEIVEVTEYPGGDRSQQPVITRTVKVLSESPGALPEGAAAFLEDFGSPEESQVTLKKLLLWIGDMEELMASQKPLSSEVKVVEAQLQEQKLFRRLLDERRPYLEELLLQNQKAPPESAGVSDGQEGSQGGGDLESLQEKWTLLIQEAEARRRSLERVLPAAQAFQESVTPFQDWLSFTERRLAQLWQIANGSLSRAQDTCQQIQVQQRPCHLSVFTGQGGSQKQLLAGLGETHPKPRQGHVD
uniref:Uncharacterized protein n=1 Tax=Salvator merianae TaxID=96440 RepID=A0A8D0BYF7_SALMN